MPTVPEIFEQAVRHHQSGQPGSAEALCRQILQVDPRHANAWHLLGVIAGQVGRYELAVEYIGHALRLMPDFAPAHYNLGVFQAAQGKLEEAAACYRRSIRLNPDFPYVHNNLGLVLREMGNLEESESSYRRSIQLKPDFSKALHNLAVVLRDQGKLNESETCYRAAIRCEPGYAEAHNNLGVILQEQGRLEEAEACYRAALSLKPAYADACSNLATVLCDLGQPEDPETYFRRALLLKPDVAEVHNNLGVILQERGRLDEAEASIRTAIALKPDYAEAHNSLGGVLRLRGKSEEAMRCYLESLRIRPGYAATHNNIANLYKGEGQWQEAIAALRQAIQCQPDFTMAQSNLLYTLVYSPHNDARAVFEEHQRWNQQYAEPLAKHIQPHANDRSPERRLRIGYVSPDFCKHAESYFTVPLLSKHDQEKFEIFCYADVLRPDEITARLRSYAHVWRKITGLKDEQAAQLVRADKIDILVDLTMHMFRNRLLVFAQKPAPVQVCWLAYQGTTGLKTMDYRLTDPIVDPPGLFDEFYSEESFHLPDAFGCYDPLARGPAISALPALANSCITFGCLNSFCKINPPVLQLWADVLRAIPTSRLLLLADEGRQRRCTLAFLEKEGIEPQRVSFAARQPHARYMELYHGIDICLDTFPYTGQTTSLDAFWMGVPVVTLVGQTAVARAGRSLLENLGLPELIADNPEQFVKIAVVLAGDRPRLRELRISLRERLRQSPLMDATRFARNVETAYRTMWRRWCAGS